MSKIELPPLPERKATAWFHRGLPNFDDYDLPSEGSHDLFTADQLRAYREQIVEVCAQIAENCSRCHPDDAEMIAAAIRKMGPSPDQ
jgi:hypothetical protein